MESNNILGMMAAYLAGDNDARLQLSDVFEEGGYDDAAKVLRGENPQQFNFDEPEAKGTVGISRGRYGPNIIIDGVDVGFIDLFGASPYGLGNDGSPGIPPIVVLYDRRLEESAVEVAVEQGKLTVIVNASATRLPDNHRLAPHSEGDHVFGFAEEEAA